MQLRNLILTGLGSALVLGIGGGLAVGTNPKPPPEPGGGDAAPPVQAPNVAYQIVDTGPQDLSPTWSVDHLPTWKRRALMQPTTDTAPQYPGGTRAPRPMGDTADRQAYGDQGGLESAPKVDDDGEAAGDDPTDAPRAAGAPVYGRFAAEQQEQSERDDPNDGSPSPMQRHRYTETGARAY